MLISAYNATEINFSNCTNLRFIGKYGMCINTKNFTPTTSSCLVNFSNCTNLNAIGDYAFEDNTAVSTIDFSGCPITTVSANAFNGCTNLQTIYCNADVGFTILNALHQAGLFHVNVTVKH